MRVGYRHDMLVEDCGVAHTRSSRSLLDMDQVRAGNVVGKAQAGAEVADSVQCDSPSIYGMREEVVPSAGVGEHANSLRGSREGWRRRRRKSLRTLPMIELALKVRVSKVLTAMPVCSALSAIMSVCYIQCEEGIAYIAPPPT